MRSHWFFLVLRAYHFLRDNSLQSTDKDQQESRAVAKKLHDAFVKFDTYRNLQRHRAVLPAIARLSLMCESLRVSVNVYMNIAYKLQLFYIISRSYCYTV